MRVRTKGKRELARGEYSVYDCLIGRIFSPDMILPLFGVVDIKAFRELRPGSLGWASLKPVFCAQVRYISVSEDIIFVIIFHAIYIIHTLSVEWLS